MKIALADGARDFRRVAPSLIRICLLGLFSTAACQGQQVPFVPITGPNAPKGAAALFQDSHGGLWLAGCESGAEGLVYFDGSRFISPLRGAFPKMGTTGMAEDSDGGIWLAATGLYRVYKGTLEKLLGGIASAGIIKIAPDVFLATVNPPRKDGVSAAGLIRVRKAQGKWRTETIVKSFGSRWLWEDRKGNILYRCEGGFCELRAADILRWRPGSMLVPQHHSMQVSANLATATSVSRDRLGCVWMRTPAEASYQCPGEPHPTGLPSSVASSIGAPQILELDNGSLVIPSFSKVAIGRPGHFRVISAINGYPSTGFALAGRDGSLWLSNANGLFLFPSHLEMEFWTQQQGLDGNTWSILRMGRKMFAIAGDAIRVLADDHSRWLHLLDLGSATHLLRGPGNTLLAGTQSNGVVQISADGKILRRSPPTQATMLTRKPSGEFWLSGTTVARITIDGHTLNLHPANLPLRQGEGSDLKTDREGALWTCYDNSLLRGGKSGWRIAASSQALSENPCRSFAMDREDVVWYTYSEQSVFSLIRIPKTIKPVILHFPSGDDVGPATNYFFESDSRGWLWRGTPNGIYVATPQEAIEGHWLHLNRRDGLPGIDANQRSFFEDADGSVWFGVDNSIVHLFPPADLVRPAYSPNVFISALSWNGQTQIADAISPIQSGSAVVAHIGSLQFDRRNALRFRYRVLPDQPSWKLQSALDIRLGKLSWGQHTLELQARLFTGPWSPVARRSFQISKPVWLSSPALAGAALAVAVLIAGALQWQTQRRKRSKKAFPELKELRLAALSPEADRLKGIILDSRFEVGEILARGGFATVAKGRDLRRGNRPCAVKIFRQELFEKAWLAKRFQQEVLALAKIQHPNVVGIYGHGTTPAGSHYLVMEFIHGKTLRSLLCEAGLHVRDTSAYLRQIGRALNEIHKQGICHRDLKPENLMIRNLAPPGHELVLIDFSIAIVKDPDETLHGLTHAAGTLCYMAPEQAIGYADPSSDIYSLAKVTIELLTGQRVSALLPDASMDLPHRIREMLPALPYRLSAYSIDMIGAALEFDPARRPKDVIEFTESIVRDLEFSTVSISR